MTGSGVGRRPRAVTRTVRGMAAADGAGVRLSRLIVVMNTREELRQAFADAESGRL